MLRLLFDWWWFENEIVKEKKTTRYWGSTLEFLMSHCVNNFKTLQYGIALDSEHKKRGDRKMSSAIKWFLSSFLQTAATSHRSSLRTLQFFLTHSTQDCDKNLKLNFHITVCSRATATSNGLFHALTTTTSCVCR